MFACDAGHISLLGRSVKYIELNKKNLFSVRYESGLREEKKKGKFWNLVAVKGKN